MDNDEDHQQDWKGSFIGKTSEYMNSMLNTVLDDPVLLRVAIRLSKICEEISED